MEPKGIAVMGLAWSLLLGEVSLAQQTILNLTDVTVAGIGPTTMTTDFGAVGGGFVGEAYFRRPVSDDDSRAGPVRGLYGVRDSSVSLDNPQEGYNRAGVMDSAVPNEFDPMLRVVDLVEDSTGTAYVFLIDTNETGTGTERYLSLDDFRIYVGGPNDPAVLPQSVVELDGAFGAPRYAMSAGGEQNHVLLDYSLFQGGERIDLFVFVPQSVFAGASADDLVYVYTSFGLFSLAGGYGPSAGPELVSIPGAPVSSPVDPFILRVPEPGITPMLFALVLLLLRRVRTDRR